MNHNHIPTGHYDRSGKMICRHDKVQVVVRPHYLNADREKLKHRPAYVLRSGLVWLLWYGNRTTEPLNFYGKEDLLIDNTK